MVVKSIKAWHHIYIESLRLCFSHVGGNFVTWGDGGGQISFTASKEIYKGITLIC